MGGPSNFQQNSTLSCPPIIVDGGDIEPTLSPKKAHIGHQARTVPFWMCCVHVAGDINIVVVAALQEAVFVPPELEVLIKRPWQGNAGQLF